MFPSHDRSDTLELLPVEMIKTDAEYKELDPEDPEIQSRARSLVRDTQLQPILIDQDFNIVDGRKRLLASRMKGLPKIYAYVKHFESDVDKKIAVLIANFERTHFTFPCYLSNRS